MNIRATRIAGAVVVTDSRFVDHRGAFSRFFCSRTLAEIIGDRHVVQINHSRTSVAGAVRGMHFQYAPHAEMKLVRCIRGRVWDVLVDLRAGSATFLQWHGEELSPDSSQMIVVPEGCAHGFQALEADSELLYLHTEFYTPESEGALCYDDPRVCISWPLPITDLSERDKKHARLSNDFAGLDV